MINLFLGNLMSCLLRIINDPFLPGGCLLQPAKDLVSNISKAFLTNSKIVQEQIFLKQFPNIPTADQTVMLTGGEIYALKISKDGKSDRILFKHDHFEVKYVQNGYEVTRKRDPEYKDHSFERILEEARSKEIIKIITYLALAILAFPILLPLSLIASLVRYVYLICGPSMQKRQLTVTAHKPNEELYKIVGKTARAWQDLAAKKEQLSKEKQQIFEDSRTISKLIAECMEQHEQCTHIFNEIILCKDAKLKGLQSIALTHEKIVRTTSNSFHDCIKIAHIVTNPINIRAKINEHEYSRVEGAGTATISYLALRALKEQKEIYLEAVKSAIPFYTSLGFEDVSVELGSIDEGGTFPMILTKEKIQKLASSSFSSI
jgi:hypothetical protein